MKQHERQKFQKLINRRTAILGGIKFSLFAALAGRLYFLQVEEAEKYRTLAENNQFNFELLPPIRGRILDRNGIPLATNKDNFRLEIVSEQTKDVAETVRMLQEIIKISPESVERIITETKKRRSFVPVLVSENLSRKEVAKVAIQTPYLPGIRIDIGQTRYYPFRDLAVHLTGYVATISQSEKTGDPVLELPGFKIGKSSTHPTIYTERHICGRGKFAYRFFSLSFSRHSVVRGDLQGDLGSNISLDDLRRSCYC